MVALCFMVGLYLLLKQNEMSETPGWVLSPLGPSLLTESPSGLTNDWSWGSLARVTKYIWAGGRRQQRILA